MQTCREIMTRSPFCCQTADSAQDAARLMWEANVGSVPVTTDGKRLVGIVTDRDLALRVLAEGRMARETPIQQVMTPNPITCQPDDDVQRVLSLMAEHQIRRIPIVDENHNIVGIVSQADIALRTSDVADVAEVVEEVSRPLA